VSQQVTDNDGGSDELLDDATAITSSESEQEDSEEEYQPVPTKRKKTSNRKPNVKDKGKLRSFVSLLPLDLVGEVCRYLSPSDLLNWSRSSKQFRKILLNRTITSSWWRNARRNVGLPDLVAEMSEPEYASLIFDKFCMAEGCSSEPRDKETDFFHRSRLCAKCMKSIMGTSFALAKSIGNLSTNRIQQCYVSFDWDPFSQSVSTIHRFVVKSDALEINEELKQASKSNLASSLQGRGVSLHEEVKRKVEFAKAVIKSREIVRSLPLRACCAKGKKAYLLVLRHTFSDVQDGNKLMQWRAAELEKIKQKKLEEHKLKCKERKETIESKMKAQGFDSVDFQAKVWQNDEDVENPKKLTPAGSSH
ncbi:hypothetical protein JCM5350_003215, partial [Sporobolomyces pararoseus]